MINTQHFPRPAFSYPSECPVLILLHSYEFVNKAGIASCRQRQSPSFTFRKSTIQKFLVQKSLLGDVPPLVSSLRNATINAFPATPAPTHPTSECPELTELKFLLVGRGGVSFFLCAGCCRSQGNVWSECVCGLVQYVRRS